MGSLCLKNSQLQEDHQMITKEENTKGKAIVISQNEFDQENQNISDGTAGKPAVARLSYDYDYNAKQFPENYRKLLNEARSKPKEYALKLEKRMANPLFKERLFVQSRGKKVYAFTDKECWLEAIQALKESSNSLGIITEDAKLSVEIVDDEAILTDELKMKIEAKKNKLVAHMIQGDCEDADTLLIIQMIDPQKRAILLNREIKHIAITHKTFGNNNFFACICFGKNLSK